MLFQTRLARSRLARTRLARIRRPRRDATQAPPTLRIAASRYQAFVFDLDGVVTDGSLLHVNAWQRLFDEYLRDRGHAPAFDVEEYHRHIKGRRCVDAVAAFLASRDIGIPRGQPADPSTRDTAYGLANRKHELFLAGLARAADVQPVPGIAALLRQLRVAGIRTAAVTATGDAGQVLGSAGLADLFDAYVDGTDLARLGLAGTADPGMFLEAARRLDVEPAQAVVIEDVLSAATPVGRQAGFGLVVGLARAARPDAVGQPDADTVIGDLAELRLVPADAGCRLCGCAEPPEWSLCYPDYDPALEGTRESLLTLGNGYLATRGAWPEARADKVHYPATYIAGVFNRLVSVVDGRTREDESIVNLPNWLPLTFRPSGGRWASLDTVEPVHHHVALDIRRGVLNRDAVFCDAQGRRTRVSQRRLVSMASPHLAALQTTIMAENWSGRLEVRSALDAGVGNTNVAGFAGLATKHLATTEIGTDGAETIWLVAETSQSKVRVAEAARTRIGREAGAVRVPRRIVTEPETVGHALTFHVKRGEEISIEKVVTVYTSRDRAISEPLTAAREDLREAPGFDDLLAAHIEAWEQLWRRFQVGLDDGNDARLAVNVQTFHLLQTLSPHTADLDAGVPARGLHGEGYYGHVFWDELFVFPFLNLRLPELTRALLLYRYRRLPQARRHAAAVGREGARFPWQSGSDGREETPVATYNSYAGRWVPEYTNRQDHVNLAVAYNVWHYWQTTADLSFLSSYGAELLIEIARYWASLATYDPSDDRYHIRGVMGPDEFHDGYPGQPGQGIDDSAYVNIMTAWTLTRAREAHRVLGQHHGDELWKRLRLTDAELEQWDRIARGLRVPFLGNGMIEQFDGYGDLAELDWEAYQARYGDGDLGRLGFILQGEGDSTNRYQVSKQADVLMLLYLFTAEELTTLLRRMGYDFDPATIPATVEYYLARTSHGSSLSRVAHAWVLSRTDRRRSWDMLREALVSDLADIQGGTTREGIHLGAMAGTLDILQRCYTGLDTRDDKLWLNPLLPDELRGLDLQICYRGQWIKIHLDHQRVTLRVLPTAAPPVTINIEGKAYVLKPGTTITVPHTDPVPLRYAPAA